jgi:hypothetical protein
MADVKIEMTIGARTFVFGLPLLLSVIIWGTIFFSRLGFDNRSQINVSSPNVEAKITVPASVVHNHVKPSDVPVTVNVPQNKSPEININQPPDNNITFKLPDNKPGEPQIIEKTIIKEIPIYMDRKNDEFGKILPNPKSVSIEDIYSIAEKYLNSWFTKNGKDPKIENKKWTDIWLSRVSERGNEQNLVNESLIEKRGGFNIDVAKIEEIIELCKIMIRIRDANLSIPSTFKEYITPENLLKFKKFLEKGP